MDFSNAMTAGYNIGKDLGYHVSGQAAEDIRLNREAKRAEIDFNNQRMQVLQAQEAREQDKYNKEVMYQKATGVKDLSKQAILAPELFLQDFIDGANSFNDEYQHFPGIRLMSFDQQLAEQQFLDFYIPAANSIYGSVKDPNDPGYQKSLAQIKSGLVMQVDENTGKITPVYVGEYLTTLGGNAGLQYIYQKIAADEAAAALKARDTQSQIERRDIQNATDIANAQTKADELNFKKGQDARTQDNIAQVINSQGGLSNVKRMDKDSVTMHSPQNGTAQQLEQQLNNTNIEMDNLAKYIQIDKNTNSFVTETPTKQDFQNQIVKTMQSLPRDAKGNITDEAKATYKKSLEDYVYQLYEHEEAGIPGATERREALESALQSYDKSFGNGKVDDRGLDDLMAIGRSAIGSANNVRNGRGVTGILANLATEGQDLFNLRTESPNFQKKMQVLNSLNNDYMTYLNTLYTGRLNNKIIDQLKKGSDWRSFTRNATEFAWALGRMADKLEEKANSASPSKAGRAKYIAKKLRLASDTLNADITVYNDLHSNVADIQTSKTGPINAPYDKSTVYFDYKDSVVYLFAKGQPQAVASMSINEFKKYRDANIDNLGVTFNEGSNFLSTKLPSTWFKATKYDTAAGL